MDRVLPISRKHLNLYKKHQHAHPQVEYFEAASNSKGWVSKTDATNEPMDITGNWRETMQITDKHNVTYLRIDYNPEAAGDYEKTTIVVAILLVVAIILTSGLGFLAWKFNK